MEELDIIELWNKNRKPIFPYQEMMLKLAGVPDKQIEEIIDKMQKGELSPIYPE